MRIVLLISFLFFSLLLSAQNKGEIKYEASYFLDSTSNLTITDLSSEKFIPFKRNENINIGYNKNAAVWCILKLKNEQSFPLKTWFCLDNNQLDSIQFYRGKSVMLLGDRTQRISPFLTSYAFPITLASKAEKHYVIRIKKGISFMNFSFQFRSEKTLTKDTKQTIFLISFLLGIIFLLILFNAILFIINKQKVYLLYISNSILTACYVMITTGFAKFFLFPFFVYFSEFRIYIASLWFINLTLFVSHFLRLNETQIKKYRFILILNCLNFLIIIITLMMVITGRKEWLNIFSILGYLNFIGVILLTLWATVKNYKINKTNSLYILIAFIPNIIWALSIILKAFKLIPAEIHTDWLVIISVYEVLIFGFILTKNYFEIFHKNNLLNKDIIVQKEQMISTITELQIKERLQIANILHDQFGSKLSYISQLLELEKNKMALSNIHEITKDLRNLSHQIMPKALDDGALISALQSQINLLNEGVDNCKIELNTFDFPDFIEKKLACVIYLVSLELISNALKHANPSEIQIEFYNYTDSYIFQYTDNGKGFNKSITPKGFGLNTIESRILGIKGSFELNSNLEDGTIIQLVIPN